MYTCWSQWYWFCIIWNKYTQVLMFPLRIFCYCSNSWTFFPFAIWWSHSLFIWIMYMLFCTNICNPVLTKYNVRMLKRVLHPWALFLKTLCIISKYKATLNKVSYGSDQKCSKELKNHSFTSVEAIVVKLLWKMCKNQNFPCFEP